MRPFQIHIDESLQGTLPVADKPAHSAFERG